MGCSIKYTCHLFLLVSQLSIVPKNDNRPYSYSRYRPGTSLQLRLMRGDLITEISHKYLFNDIPPRELSLKASSSPILIIRNAYCCDSGDNDDVLLLLLLLMMMMTSV